MKQEHASDAYIDSRERLAYRLREIEAMTGVPVRSLRTQAALGRLVITKLGPKTSVVLLADLQRFLADARARSGAR